MKHHTDSLKCLRRATASIAQSDFIDKRCQQITMVCPHSPYEDSKTGAMVIAEVIIATPVMLGLTVAALGQLDPAMPPQRPAELDVALGDRRPQQRGRESARLTCHVVARSSFTRWFHADPKKRQQPALGTFLLIERLVADMRLDWGRK